MAFNALTVDLEEYFQVSNFDKLIDRDRWDTLPSRVVEQTLRLLDLFDSTQSRATFFALGWIAERHPKLLRQIAERGHEIACHSWAHDLVYETPAASFEEQVRRAKGLLEDHAQQPVVGFRAPSWSITSRSLWALDVLVRLGFRYDSSIFPVANYLYGIDGAPTSAYRMHLASGASLVEVPASVVRVGPWGVGVAGGIYLRALPLAFHRWARRRILAGGEVFVAYVHPRELDPGAWQLRTEGNTCSPGDVIRRRLGWARPTAVLQSCFEDFDSRIGGGERGFTAEPTRSRERGPIGQKASGLRHDRGGSSPRRSPSSRWMASDDS